MPDEPDITEKDRVLVSVVVGDRIEDVSLPVHRPTKNVAYTLANYLVHEKGYPLPYLNDPAAELLLTPEIGPPFPADATLSSLKITDGKTLILTSTDRNEHYPEFTSNPARAVADTQTKFFEKWTEESSRKFYATMFPLSVVVASLVGLAALLWHGDTHMRWPMVGVSAALLVVCVFIMFAVSKWAQVPTERVLVSYSVTSYMCAATIGAALVPGSPGRWHAAAAATAVVLLALILLGAIRRPIWLHYAAGTTAAAVVIVLAINLPLSESGNVVTSMIMLLAFALTYYSNNLAMSGSGIRLPRMPTPGDRLHLTRGMDMVEMSRSVSSGEDLTSEVNQESNVVDMHNIMVAIAGGMSLLVMLNSGISMAIVDRDHMWMQFSFCAFLSVLVYLFGTWAVDQGLRGITMALGIAVWLSALVGMVISSNTTPWMLGSGLLVLTLFAFATGTRMWRDGLEFSEPMARKLMVGETILYVAPLIHIFFLMDGFTRLRELHLGG